MILLFSYWDFWFSKFNDLKLSNSSGIFGLL